jgi:hypothetical protein
MNPATIASSFTVQKISKHHYLIRGDERIRTYMKFCELKWSKTYQGWIVHEDDEVDLLRLHTEVLDNLKETRKNKKETPKTKKEMDRELYERFKRGEDITDDEDDEYEPSSDKTDDYEEDSFCVKDSTEEEEVKPAKKQSKKKVADKEVDKEVNEWIKNQKKKSKKVVEAEPEPEEEEEEDSESEEEEDGETDPNRKREYQFYKRGILAYGIMTEKQQEKTEAIWNKHLRGWILRKSFQEKLQKMGWVEVDDSSTEKKSPPVVVHTPQVVSKKAEVKPKTFENHKNMLLVKGYLDLSSIAKMEAIFHPVLVGHLVSKNFRSELVELGFVDESIPEKTESVKLSFSVGEKLDLPVKNDV